MAPRRLPLALLGLLAAAPAAAQDAPRFAGAFALPYLLCDCDPADFVFRATQPLPGYAEADASGPVVRTVEAGERIAWGDWDSELTVVDTPAVAVALRDVALALPDVYGDVRYLEPDFEAEIPALDALPIAEGDTVAVMTWDEGYVYFRHGGVLYGTGDVLSDDDFRWLRRASTESSWLHLVAQDDRPAAWVRIDTAEPPAGNVEVVCGTHAPCER